MMKKLIFTLVMVASAGFLFAQTGSVGINTPAAGSPKATLDIIAHTTDGANAEGILIPRVDRAKTGTMASVETSTLVYISDVSNGTQTGVNVDVDAVGFYYYNGTKWVKMGGAAATKTIKVVAHITQAEWDNNQYALVQTGNGGVELPDPSANKNRVISVCNQYNNSIGYTVNPPKGNSALYAGKGHLLMSDGTHWYTIGGSY